MPFTTLLIDLDDTVYPPSSGMWGAIAARIDRYMSERLHIPHETIPALREELHGRYGTTLRGLAATRAIDELDYLAFVHDLPVGDYLTPDPRVRAALQSLPLPKWIFTNADEAHSRRVLAALELDDLFAGTVDIRAIHPYCKPMPEAYRAALSRIAVSPQECVFIDDSMRNLAPARAIGMGAILVTPQCGQSDGIPCITNLADLPSALVLLD
jgi:putative hydrolase of the HAD superfamily